MQRKEEKNNIIDFVIDNIYSLFFYYLSGTHAAIVKKYKYIREINQRGEEENIYLLSN
jgi:hypothetical protein